MPIVIPNPLIFFRGLINPQTRHISVSGAENGPFMITVTPAIKQSGPFKWDFAAKTLDKSSRPEVQIPITFSPAGSNSDNLVINAEKIINVASQQILGSV